MPLLSIITVCYNSSKTIERTLQSVLNLKFKDYEYIIVDGASTDGTVDFIKKYESLFEGRIKWISEPDLGIYYAFNKGWKMAAGEWVHYLGSDDEMIADGMTSLFSEAGDLSKTDVIYGNIYYRKENGELDIHRHSSHKNLPWKLFACHQAVVMKKAIIEKLNGFDTQYRIIADKDLIIRSYMHIHCNYTPTEANVCIFQGGGESSNYWKSYKEDYLIYKKLKPGFRYLLYIIFHYPWMWIKSKLGRL